MKAKIEIDLETREPFIVAELIQEALMQISREIELNRQSGEVKSEIDALSTTTQWKVTIAQ
jgi:hypothetical protein